MLPIDPISPVSPNTKDSEQFAVEEEGDWESLEEIDVYMDTATARRHFQLSLPTNSVPDSMPTSPPPSCSLACQDNAYLPQYISTGSQSASNCAHPPSNNSTQDVDVTGVLPQSLGCVDDRPINFCNILTHPSISECHSSSSTIRSTARRWSSSSTHKTGIAPLSVVVRDLNRMHLASSVAHLRTPLVPLISVRTGIAHPEFPNSILQYHLLTHAQLDSLARWYHQTLDAGRERYLYPAPIKEGKSWTFTLSVSELQGSSSPQQESGSNISDSEINLETKRRRWGRFIGLRGCESPVDEEEEVDVVVEGAETSGQQQEESLAARMEREWRDALRRAEDENRVMDKIWRGRF